MEVCAAMVVASGEEEWLVKIVRGEVGRMLADTQLFEICLVPLLRYSEASLIARATHERTASPHAQLCGVQL